MRLSAADWLGPDIVALDSAGTVHVFELKYGAPTRSVLEQALAYALTMLARTSTESWSSASLAADRDGTQMIARRVAGVLGNKRVDRVSDGLDVICGACGLDVNTVTAMAEAHLQPLAPASRQWPGWRLNDVHLPRHYPDRPSPRDGDPALEAPLIGPAHALDGI